MEKSSSVRLIKSKTVVTTEYTYAHTVLDALNWMI